MRSPLRAVSLIRGPGACRRGHADDPTLHRYRAGPSRFVLVRDPAAIWRILVTDGGSFRPGKWKHRSRRYLGDTINVLHGEEHRRRRMLLQPVLDRRRVAHFVPAIVAHAERAQAKWQDGARVCLRDDLDRLALAVGGDVLLSTDLEVDADRIVPALRSVMAAIPRLLPPLHGSRRRRQLHEIQQIVSRVAADRRSSQIDRGDLLDALQRGGLAEETVHGETIGLLIAVVDEPPLALEAACYLLARHQAAQARLQSELDTILGDRRPAAADEARLPFLAAVIRETLRLLPPTRQIDRRPVHDVEIGVTPISRRTNIVIRPLVTQCDPALYERPFEFVPERWLDADAGPPRGAYLPFGAGVHTCIGESLAMSIVTFTLATISRRWHLRVDADAPAPSPLGPDLVVTLAKR